MIEASFSYLEWFSAREDYAKFFSFAFVLIFVFNHSSVINFSMVSYCFSIHIFICDFLCTAGASSVAFLPSPLPSPPITSQPSSTLLPSLPCHWLFWGSHLRLEKRRLGEGVRKFWTRRSNRRLFVPNKSSWVTVETELKNVMKIF